MTDGPRSNDPATSVPVPVGALETRETVSPWVDRIRFLRAWAREPLSVAALAPSSRSLANLITREVSVENGPVLELGPGTGVFTRALLGRGIAPKDITLVESSADFARLLRRDFPGIRIFEADAVRIPARALFPGQKAGAVISGLGLLSMSPGSVAEILATAFKCMGEGGAFYQFTYGPRCPVPHSVLRNLDLEAQRIGGTMWNFPPASVYRIRRRASMRISSTDLQIA